MSAGEPDATEIGHVRFGGGPSEKGLFTGTSLAAYPTACTVRAGGLRKRTDGNVSTAPQADPTAARNGPLTPPPGRVPGPPLAL